MSKPIVVTFDPKKNPGGFTFSDFSKSSSPIRTIEAIVNLLNDISNNERFVIRRTEFPKLPHDGDPVNYEVLYRSDNGDHRSTVFTIHLSKGWPITIHDSGRRRGTRLSVARAEKKIKSGGWNY